MIRPNSKGEDGQPWRRRRGTADGEVERDQRKWILTVSEETVMGVVNCGKRELRWDSWARQS